MNQLPATLIPDNDAARVQALHRYQVLDARSERVFDELVAITAALFQAPISLISLVDADEVLFKGNYGLPGAERVGRHLSLCSTAVLQDETVVFEDLEEKPCQLTDPLVARQLNLRFYAGHALQTTDGYNIGTFCVIDRRPRTFSAAESELLGTLADVAMRLLDLRLALGATPDTSFRLWEPIYSVISGLLQRLRALAAPAPAVVPDTYSVPDATAREANALARQVNQHIQTALSKV